MNYSVKVLRTEPERVQGALAFSSPLPKDFILFFPNVQAVGGVVTMRSVPESLFIIGLDSQFRRLVSLVLLPEVVWPIPEGIAHIAEMSVHAVFPGDFGFLSAYL